MAQYLKSPWNAQMSCCNKNASVKPKNRFSFHFAVRNIILPYYLNKDALQTGSETGTETRVFWFVKTKILFCMSTCYFFWPFVTFIVTFFSPRSIYNCPTLHCDNLQIKQIRFPVPNLLYYLVKVTINACKESMCLLVGCGCMQLESTSSSKF